MIFSLEILEKNVECILILVIYWKKTGLLHTKISNLNTIYSSQKPLTSTVLFDGTSNVEGTKPMFPNCPILKHSFFLMFMTYLWNSIIFL